MAAKGGLLCASIARSAVERGCTRFAHDPTIASVDSMQGKVVEDGDHSDQAENILEKACEASSSRSQRLLCPAVQDRHDATMDQRLGEHVLAMHSGTLLPHQSLRFIAEAIPVHDNHSSNTRDDDSTKQHCLGLSSKAVMYT